MTPTAAAPGTGAAARPVDGTTRRSTAVVVFGDVVTSRRRPEESTAWLRRLVTMLDEAYPIERLAPFAFTQGDEIQGLLDPAADPFRAILIGALAADSRRMRWMVAAGTVVPGEGPATERAGEAFLAARAGIERLRQERESIHATSGDERADGLLARLAPLLGELLDDLSARQREVARLALVEGYRQSAIASRLDVSAATISVISARGRIRSIGRLASALREILADGIRAVDQAATAVAATEGAAAGGAAPERVPGATGG